MMSETVGLDLNLSQVLGLGTKLCDFVPGLEICFLLCFKYIFLHFDGFKIHFIKI